MKSKKIKIKLYLSTVEVVYSKNLNDIADKYNLIDLTGYNATTFRHKGRYVVCFNSFDASTITHEATHIKNFIFQDCGQGLDLVNDEAEAYLMGFLVKEISKTLKKLIKNE